MNFDKYYPFEAVPLPYGMEALEPHISPYTLYFHHDKHYQGYVDKLNALIAKSPTLQNVPLPALTKMKNEAVRTNAGGVYNHELYFSSLTPDGGKPSPEMTELIRTGYGSEKELWGEMIGAGMGITGSGYVWLVLDENGRLQVLTTANQDTIDFDRYTPLLNIDVWEHAYYLDYQNRRVDYLNGLKNIINWEHAERGVPTLAKKS